MIFSLHGAVMTFLLLNMIFGEYGIIKRNKLEDYKAVLSGNIHELQVIGSKLKEHSLSLRTDPDRVALLARELGYRKENEVLVSIDGYNNPPEHYAIGKTITRSESSKSNTLILGTLAILSGISIFFLITVIRKNNHGNKRV